MQRGHRLSSCDFSKIGAVEGLEMGIVDGERVRSRGC